MKVFRTELAYVVSPLIYIKVCHKGERQRERDGERERGRIERDRKERVRENGPERNIETK